MPLRTVCRHMCARCGRGQYTAPGAVSADAASGSIWQRAGQTRIASDERTGPLRAPSVLDRGAALLASQPKWATQVGMSLQRYGHVAGGGVDGG